MDLSGHLYSILIKPFPDFDVLNFSYSKMTPFLESISNIETRKAQKDETIFTWYRLRIK